MKSEPDVYSWETLCKDGRGTWDGVRNFTARNNLRAMKLGDHAFFYHSNIGREIVGIAEIVREFYPDSTAKGGDWSVVDVKPLHALARAVTLAEVRAEPKLKEMALVRRARLSVQPVTPEEFKMILKMAEKPSGSTTGIEAAPKARPVSARRRSVQ
jgi:predicted RNA-binding protein with PUA-like domain